MAEAPGRPSDEKITVRVEPSMRAQVQYCAKALGMRQNDFLVDALRRQIMLCTVSEADAIVAPLVSELLTANLKNHTASLRKVNIRLAYEVMRLQYLFCEFLVRANFTPGEVDRLRNEGWSWAVKAFKAQPGVADEEGRS